MAILEDLIADVDKIARNQWEITDGRTVPETEEVGLGNKGVRLEVTMLYADLADSTELASYKQTVAAEVYKAFLVCCSKLIRHHGGYIRSFDGDRVMGVFIGNPKNTPATKTALQIKYVFREVIVPRFKQQYEVFKQETLKLNYCVGIDTGSVLVARAGIRNNNDLVWVGQVANVAAKLSTLRKPPYNSYITKAVYDGMHDDAKFGGQPKQSMWEARTWTALPTGKQDIYRSSWQWKP